MFPQITLTNTIICLQTLQEELLMLVFYVYTCSEMYVYYRFPLLVGGRGEEGGGRRGWTGSAYNTMTTFEFCADCERSSQLLSITSNIFVRMRRA